jgi:phosphotransferase system IIA component
MQGAAVACLPHRDPITAPLAPDVAGADSQRHAYLVEPSERAELVILYNQLRKEYNETRRD